MFDFGLIVMLVFIILFSFIAFKVVKQVLKLTFLITILTIVVLGLFSYLVYQDMGDLKENFSFNDNLLILQNENQLLTGVKLNFEKISDFEELEAFNSLSQDQINEYNPYYTNEEYDKILGDHYKILFIDYNTFQDIQEIEVLNKAYSNEFVLQVLESQNPMELLTPKSLNIKSSENIKPILFTMLLTEKIKLQKSTFLITEMKNKNIRVYPETITFKIIKYIPVDFMQDQLAKISEKVKQEEEQ
tara:strand:- start:42 stop:776 length:735 start_codon:yes stop_codon:yes gene_type:complete